MEDPTTDDRTSGRDALVAYRERILYSLALVAMVSLLPFAINNVLSGRWVLGVTVLVAVVLLGVDALAISRQRRPPVPFGFLLVPMVLGISLSLRSQGFIGALWSYPVIVFLYFVFTRRVATVCSVAILLLVTTLTYQYVGFHLASRVFVTLAMTIVFTTIIVNLIGELHGRLIAQAIVDPLTGAYNRRHMEQCLSDAIERRARSGAPASVLLLDVDHFKQINDEVGHAAGDTVLQGLVTVITGRSRKLDGVFRAGGEEFILLLPETREKDAAHLAEKLRTAIADAPLLRGRPVSVSVGVSELRDGDTRDTWIRNADEALYRAKSAGRNRVMRRAVGDEGP